MDGMRRHPVFVLCAALALALALACVSCGNGPTNGKPKPTTPGTAPANPPPARNSTGLPLTIPAGFSVSVFASGLDSPRVLGFDPGGTLLVSTPGSGQVLALPDRDGDGTADSHVEVAGGLDDPHGFAFRPGSGRLYVAETGAVSVMDYDPAAMRAANPARIIDLPSGGGHHTRTIMFAPPPNEGMLLVAVGSSCNVCNETDPRRAKILIANADGSGLRPFGSGLRNSVFMTVHPVTGKVWATEMGRDLLGDDVPPDEINVIEDGKDYGWPICYGKNIHDTQFDKNTYVRDPCADKTPSHVDLQAHSAPLGLAFVTSDAWPSEYKYDLIVAFHGSWNRSVATGYKLVRIRLDERGDYQGTEDFITGWLRPDGSVLGRPAGVLMGEDGTCYVSDDRGGVIYRIAPIPTPS